MAITATHYELFRRLPLLRGGTLLEIGEANWYGDFDPSRVAADYPEATEAIAEAVASRDWFKVAKACYAAIFAPSKNVAIDLMGSPSAIRHDLNQRFWFEPPGPPEWFDVVVNQGTAEHIFNVAQVFETMHVYCATGGLMIHDAPFTGWVDHGFYSLQPTLFFDLAAANNYELVIMVAHDFKSGEIVRIERRDLEGYKFPAESSLFVCFRKLFDQPFRVPMQGYYARVARGEAA